MSKTDSITVKIGADTSDLEKATEALNKLAEAAANAKVALSDLFGHPALVIELRIDSADVDYEEMRSILNKGVRPAGKRFQL